MKYLLLTILFLISFALPTFAQSPFYSLDFDKACLKAKEEKKVVLIDFFTTWCGPCKKLDAVTWKDKDVINWLEQNTIALKIDAEKEESLANRYKVSAYPTIAIISPEGKVIDSIVGYREPAAFLSNAKDALAGKTALIRAKEKFTQNVNDPDTRSNYARELFRVGSYEEALTHYLWCFDEALNYVPNYAGVRTSFLLSDIARLGQKYPPALEALIERRSKAEKQLADVQNIESNETLFFLAHDFIAINRSLGKEGNISNLEFYAKVKQNNQKRLEASLLDEVLDSLLEAKRYNDIVESAANILDRIEEKIVSYQRFVEINKKLSRENIENTNLIIKRNTINESVKYFTALLGVKDLKQAQTVAEKIISFDSSKETLSLLAKQATEFGQTELANQFSPKN
ncbi:MAG: thioredoxin domain-containing protein [Blastocatellia bacterium]